MLEPAPHEGGHVGLGQPAGQQRERGRTQRGRGHRTRGVDPIAKAEVDARIAAAEDAHEHGGHHVAFQPGLQQGACTRLELQRIAGHDERHGVILSGLGGRVYKRECMSTATAPADELPILWQLQISHFNEKVRWALDLKRVPHVRRSLLPGAHAVQARRLTGADTTPVLTLDGRSIGGLDGDHRCARLTLAGSASVPGRSRAARPGARARGIL